MRLEETAQHVQEIFVDNQWEFEGYGVPEQDDMQVFLETCVQHLQDKPAGTVLSVSNMSVRKSTDEYEVFVHVGSFKEEEDE